MSKKMVSFFAIVTLLFICCSGVYASVTPYSQYLIQDMSSRVDSSSSGNLLISGSTFTFFTVDEVKVTVYLQRWNGSSWVDVGSGITNTSYNQRLAITSAERFVTKNEFYRTRSIHVAKIGGSTETKYFYSSAYYHQ